MYNFIVDDPLNGFVVMNYVLMGTQFILFLLPFLTWHVLIKYPELNKKRYFYADKNHATDEKADIQDEEEKEKKTHDHDNEHLEKKSKENEKSVEKINSSFCEL